MKAPEITEADKLKAATEVRKNTIKVNIIDLWKRVQVRNIYIHSFCVWGGGGRGRGGEREREGGGERERERERDRERETERDRETHKKREFVLRSFCRLQVFPVLSFHAHVCTTSLLIIGCIYNTSSA